MDNLLSALMEIRQHAELVAEMFQLDTWPVMPGYESLLKAVANLNQLDAETFGIWFENHCESIEQLQRYIQQHNQ